MYVGAGVRRDRGPGGRRRGGVGAVQPGRLHRQAAVQRGQRDDHDGGAGDAQAPQQDETQRYAGQSSPKLITSAFVIKPSM